MKQPISLYPVDHSGVRVACAGFTLSVLFLVKARLRPTTILNRFSEKDSFCNANVNSNMVKNTNVQV